MTAPLTPEYADLRDFPFTPIFRSRLFGSSFHARTTDAEWRAGVTLWLKSWDQVPAGSLPNDDIELCRLAELARDLKSWRKIREGAMRGWLLCDDGRMYHPVVAEGVNEAIHSKVAQRAKTAKARIAALEKHLSQATTDADRERLTDEIKRLRQSLSLTQSQASSKPVTESVTESVPESKRSIREVQGEGIGRGTGNIKTAAPNGAGVAKADPVKEEIWRTGKGLLESQGETRDTAGAFLGKLCKDYGQVLVLDAVRDAVTATPAEAKAWLMARCQDRRAQSGNKSAAIEQRNRAAVEAALREAGHAGH